MKKLLLTFFSFAIFWTITGCKKDPPEAILPDDVEFGKSIIFLNGEEVDYLPDFKNDTFNHLMNYPFVQTKDQGTTKNVFTFDWLPLSTGNFQLTTDNIPRVKAVTSFGQIIDVDTEGYKYKLVDEEEGFLNIESLDTIKMEVKGRFKAKFCRTSKNGQKDLGLPEILLFQGVFYDKYQFK